jgi:hypothetical protein
MQKKSNRASTRPRGRGASAGPAPKNHRPISKRHAAKLAHNERLPTNEAIDFNAVYQKTQSNKAAVEHRGRNVVGSLAQSYASSYACQYMMVPIAAVGNVKLGNASYNAQHIQTGRCDEPVLQNK